MPNRSARPLKIASVKSHTARQNYMASVKKTPLGHGQKQYRIMHLLLYIPPNIWPGVKEYAKQ